MRSKDIVIVARFTFAPNFRKALAQHTGKPTCTNTEIREWIAACINECSRPVEDRYYTTRMLEGRNAH